MVGTSELIRIVQKEFEYVLGHEGPDLWRTLPGLLEYLARDPRVSGVIGEMRAEVRRLEAEFSQVDRRQISELKRLWRAIGGQARELARVGGDQEQRVLQDFDRFEKALGRPPSQISFPRHQLPYADETVTHALLEMLQPYYKSLLKEARSRWDETKSTTFVEACSVFKRVDDQRAHQFRAFCIAAHTAGGVAIERLINAAGRLNPHFTEEMWADPERQADVLAFLHSREELAVVHERDTTKEAKRKLATTLRLIRADLAIARHDVCHRLAVGASHVALVRRFAARSERYDAERFRSLVKKNSRRAEGVLTQEFARFLFDQGMNPLVDPKIAGLRPDVLEPHLDAPVYVEAKQYAARSPLPMLRKAVAQVWDTWGRLSSTYEIREAFLVVFRLGGPRLPLPEFVSHGRNRLYLQLVDIGEERLSGSKQRLQPLEVPPELFQPNTSRAVKAKRSR